MEEINVENVCRLCLAKLDQPGERLSKWADGVLLIIGLEVFPDDGLPQLICPDCSNGLSIATKLRNTAYETDMLLKKYRKEVKSELENDEGENSKPNASVNEDVEMGDAADKEENKIEMDEFLDVKINFPDLNKTDGESPIKSEPKVVLEKLPDHVSKASSIYCSMCLTPLKDGERLSDSEDDNVNKCGSCRTFDENGRQLLVENKKRKRCGTTGRSRRANATAIPRLNPKVDQHNLRPSKNKIIVKNEEMEDNDQAKYSKLMRSQVNILRHTKMQNLRYEPTQRNGIVLINDDGFCYLRHKAACDAGSEYWMCELRKRCPGRGITRNNRNDFYQTKEHNHLPDKLSSELRSIRNNIRILSQNSLNDSTTNSVLETALMSVSSVAIAKLPCVDNIKRSVQRIRSKTFVSHPLPLIRDEINVPDNLKFTISPNQKENFLLWDSGPSVNGDERILIFGTEKNVEHLKSCNVMLMDGTFKNIPLLFSQLYTIHCSRFEGPDEKPGKSVPVLFLLLPNKTLRTYMRAFGQLKTFLSEWEPEYILTDFEKTAISTVEVFWPNSIINCSFYHLNQNMWEKIEEVGLSMFYGEDVENAVRLKMICALAYVPPESVIEAWEELLEILRPWLQIQNEQIECKIYDVLNYFEENYIGQNVEGIRQEPQTANISMWNVRQRSIQFFGRTDNEADGFRLKVGHSAATQFQNLWKFLKGLQDVQSKTEKGIEEINAGVVKLRFKYLRLSDKIRNILVDWENKESLEAYLKGISHNFFYES